MKLSKERLVELLLETQDNPSTIQPWYVYPYYPATDNTPCWAPGGYCSNPHQDCVNCPRSQYIGSTWSTTTTQTNLEGTAFPGNAGLQNDNEKSTIQ